MLEGAGEGGPGSLVKIASFELPDRWSRGGDDSCKRKSNSVALGGSGVNIKTDPLSQPIAIEVEPTLVVHETKAVEFAFVHASNNIFEFWERMMGTRNGSSSISVRIKVG